MEIKKYPIYLLLLLLLFSCKKRTEEVVPNVGEAYYPVKKGNYIVYEVDSTAYTLLPVDTVVRKYRIKEEMDTLFTDNEGRPTIRLVRYKKPYSATVAYDQMPWTLQDVWMANKTTTTAEVVEENVRFIKLVFPVKSGKTWNGNAQNTQAEMNYKYANVDETYKINGFTFGKTLRVNQKSFTTLISNQIYYELYAEGVGMIYKEIINVKSNNTVPGVNIMDRIEEGVIYKMKIVEYHLAP